MCGDIEFTINVNVKDVSYLEDNNIIRQYTLSDAETNKLFTIIDTNNNNVNTVVIDNNYIIKMLAKQDGDEFLYYYQDGKQYAVRGLYLGYSLSHSTKLVVNQFGYPIVAIDNIAMTVNYSLLDGSVNYTQFIEVGYTNRHLDFYVEVAETVEIEFEIKSNQYDKFKLDRQISINDVVVVSAQEGDALTVKRTYLGYLGQENVFKFMGNQLYYSSANLVADYVDDSVVDDEFVIDVNSNIKYVVGNKVKIIIELMPKTYNLDGIIEYNDEQFNILDFANVVNASGVNIFDTVYGVVIKADKNNIDPVNGIYYYGDKVLINYTLSDSAKNDFIVSVYCNDRKLYYNYNQSAYVAEFTGQDVTIKIAIEAKTDKVILTTNMPNELIANIYAQINNGEIVAITDDDNTQSYTALTLINGDKLTVYIKCNVGYNFTGYYEYHNKQVLANQNQGSGEYESYIKVTLFDTGFDLTQSGWYYLWFETLSLNVEFKYYVISPEVAENVDAGYGYAVSGVIDATEGRVNTLIKGTDNVGFRFDGYTYIAPKGQENSKEFDLTKVDETRQNFVQEGELLDYLGTLPIVNKGLKLTIYINYVEQYAFDLDYQSNENLVNAKVLDSNNDELVEGVYYDYGTQLVIDIQAKDVKHYKLEMTLTNKDGQEIISTSTMNSVELAKDSVVTTNLGNLSGFIANRQLISKYTIAIKVLVEKYNTVLNQNLYKQVGVSETPQSVDLQNQSDEYFHLYENIYYKVSANHEYGTQVVVTVFVLKPMDRTQQYYVIDSAYLNDAGLTINYDGEGELNGIMGDCYTFTT